MRCKACGESLTVPERKAKKSKPPAAAGKAPRRAAPPPVVGRRTKKKKKRKVENIESDESLTRGLSPAMIAMLIVPVVLLVAGLSYGIYRGGAGGSGAAQEPVAAAPAQMSRYESEHGNFSIDHPEDWSVSGGGGTGGVPPWARFESDDAYFQVRASPSGAAVGDISGAGGGMFSDELPEDLEPVAQVHNFQKMKIEVDYSDYDETPGIKIEPPYGEGRLSTFTGGEGLLGSSVKGYRATFIGTNFQFNIIAKCPEDQWDQYEATFKKMIDSLGR